MSFLSMTTEIPRVKLLEILKKNLDEHKKIYEESVEGWKKETRAGLDKVLGQLDRGEMPEYYQFVRRPENYSKTYESAISMLEMGMAENIILQPDDFERLVLDKWEWQNQFLASNASYSGTALRKMK